MVGWMPRVNGNSPGTPGSSGHPLGRADGSHTGEAIGQSLVDSAATRVSSQSRIEATNSATRMRPVHKRHKMLRRLDH